MKQPQPSTHPLESLLQQHCPNGVEFKELGELFTIKNGYTPSKAKAEFWESGSIPWFRMEDIQKNGRILKDSIQHITPQAVKGKLFPANSIIIATTATIGEHALVIVDYLSNQQFTCLIPQVNCCEQLNMKFMFYYGFILGEWCRNNVNKSAFPSVKMDKFKKLKIPLPPLEIQYKIVEILDAFTELQAELQAELEARLKQYHYYRNKLLSHDELENRTAKYRQKADSSPNAPSLSLRASEASVAIHKETPLEPQKVDSSVKVDCHDFAAAKSRNDSDPATLVPYVRLGEIGKRNAGTKITAHQMQALHKENAPIRIFAGGSTIADVDYRDLPKKDVIDKPSIICKARGYIGFEYYDKPFSHKSEFWSYTIEKNANQKFIYYFLVNQQEYFQQIAKANSVKIPQLKVKNTDKFQIPLPPLEVQNEIVELLDKFDTLTNDLTSGIPAEIEARKKQYEHYRERLLSFKEQGK